MARPSRTLVLGIVIAATMAISSVFALVKGVNGVPAFLRSSWRLQSTVFATAPLAVFEYFSNPVAARAAYDQPGALRFLGLTALSYAAYNMFFSLGLTMACVMHVVIFAQSSPLLLVVHAIARGEAVSRRQLAGCLLAFFGAAVTASEETHGDDHAPSTTLGIAFSLLAAAGYASYVSCGSRVRAHVSLYLYLAPMCAVAACIAAVASLAVEGTLLSAHPDKGLFGWLHHSRFQAVMLIGLLPGLAGLSGVSYGFKFIAPLEATVIANLEPLFGTLLGIALGEPVPGPTVLLGAVLLLAGTAAVVDSSGGGHGAPPPKPSASVPDAEGDGAESEAESDV